METEQQNAPPCVLCCTWTNYEFNTDYDYFNLLKLNVGHKGVINWLETSLNFSLDFKKIDVTICEGHFDKEDIKKTVNENGEAAFDLINEMVTPAFTNPSKMSETNRICNFNDLLEGYQKCLNLEPNWITELKEMELNLKSKLNAAVIKISSDLHVLLHENNSYFEKGSILETHLDNGYIVYWSRLRALMNFCEDNSPLAEVLVRLGSTVVLIEEDMDGLGEIIEDENEMRNDIPLTREVHELIFKTEEDETEPNDVEVEVELLTFDNSDQSNVVGDEIFYNEVEGFGCPECNFKSHRKSRVIFHMKYHSSQFQCQNCVRCFPTRSLLNRHTWICNPGSNSALANTQIPESIEESGASINIFVQNDEVEDSILPDDGDAEDVTIMKIEPDIGEIQIDESVINDEPINDTIEEETGLVPPLTWFETSPQPATETMYYCNYCSYSCNDEKELIQHKKYHTYTCTFCERGFHTAYNLKRHLAAHIKAGAIELNEETESNHSNNDIELVEDTMGNKYSCTFCDKSFPTSYNLKRHLATHINAGEIQINEETENKEETNHQESFLITEISQDNTDSNEDQMYHCEFCTYKSDKKSNLATHRKYHISNYKCRYCNKCLPSNFHVRRHERQHEREAAANQQIEQIETEYVGTADENGVFHCDSITVNTAVEDLNANDDERGHIENNYEIMYESIQESSMSDMPIKYSGDRDASGFYNCDFCSYKSDKRNNLATHRKYHVSIHKCKICQRCFPSPFHLKRHRSQHVKHAEDNDSSASESTTLKTKVDSNIDYVIEFHESERDNNQNDPTKKYSCQNCSFKTNNKRGLMAHQKIHKHKCEVCFKYFWSVKNLKRHMKTHRELVQIPLENQSNIEFAYEPVTDFNDGSEKEIQDEQNEPKINFKPVADILQINESESDEPIISDDDNQNDTFQNENSDHDISILQEEDPLNVSSNRESTKNIHKCQQCEYKSRHKHKLEEHMKSHDTDKDVPNQNNNATIEIVDTDSSDTMDSITLENNKEISDIDNIITRIESGFLIYVCTKCSYKSTTKLGVRNHIKNKHGTTYNCRLCSETFRSSKDLQHHLNGSHAREETST